MRSHRIPALAGVILFLGLSLAVPSRALADFMFTTIDFPGANYNEAEGINASGQIVGEFGQPLGHGFPQHGFLKNGATFTQIDYPGSQFNHLFGINQSGLMVGTRITDHERGFLYDGTTFTDIVPPGTGDSNALGINTRGQVVGGTDSGQGYIFDHGTFTYFDVPGQPAGINDADKIVGYFSDALGVFHGFLKDGAIFRQIDPPGATWTNARGINNMGQIVGVFVAGGSAHGFVTTDGVNFSQIDVPGALGTQAFGINDAGLIVGVYTDSSHTVHGFLASPTAAVPEPSTLTLGAIGIAGLAGYGWRRRKQAA